MQGLLANLTTIRNKEFPQLDKLARVYLDNGATTQAPRSVIQKMFRLRLNELRGSNHSENSREAKRAQKMFDEARSKVEKFFGARNYFVAFTSGTTGASNALAARFMFQPGDLLLISEMEHNSQVLSVRNFAKKHGADIKFVPVTIPDGRLDLRALKRIISARKHKRILLMLVHVSNVTGIINPLSKIRKILGRKNFIYLDMAQSAGHLSINLDRLDADFAGVSAHKMYGPMGVGALFVKKSRDKYLSNEISGGSAVKLVGKQDAAFDISPARLEPGTQNIEGVIEWGFTIDFLRKIGMKKIEKHDRALGKYFLKELGKIPNVYVAGPKDLSRDRIAVVTFNIGSSMTNYEEAARKLDRLGVSVRDGCFCAHLLLPKLLGVSEKTHNAKIKKLQSGATYASLGIEGAVRVAFAFYNNASDVRRAILAIKTIASQQATLPRSPFP